MPWIMYFLAGGGSFLPGAALLVAAVGARAASNRRWCGAVSVALAVIGAALVAISAEALAWGVYCVWAAAMLAWFLRGIARTPRLRWTIDGSVLAITFCAVAIAISYRSRPAVPPVSVARVYVVGDSISAGIGNEHEDTWPKILAAEHRVRVIDLSQAGETLDVAARRLRAQTLAEGLVILEIGGNDIIGRVSPERFGADLSALAQRARAPGRQVVMLELPLFPFDNAYGLQQRRVASRYEIRLIPRRYFAQVLASPGATLDGIHLSTAGQHRMARMIWSIIGPSLRASPRTAPSASR